MIPFEESPVVVESLTLDRSDPFEDTLAEMLVMNRRKRSDYAADGNIFSNFEFSARLLGVEGFGALEAVLFNVSQKLARLNSLRVNGRMNNPQNEAVVDSYLDLAVYASIAYALAKQQAQELPF